MVYSTRRPDDDLEDHEESSPEIQKGLSAVASLPGRNIIVFIIILIAVMITVYYTFFSGDDKNKPKKPVSEVSAKIETSKPVSAEPEMAIPTVPSLPDPPPLVVPTPPPPPPPPPSISAPAVTNTPNGPPAVLPAFGGKEIQEQREALEARKKSGIMLGGGGGGGDKAKSLLGGSAATKSGGDDNIYFSLKRTEAEQQKAARIGSTESTIAQGKVIDAILETAINTDLPGVLRAIVSRDVYAESGKAILIPKGSRLIGTYSAQIKRGQSRVNITWTRIIRPDGVDVMVNSPGTDQLGRAGVEGEVDNKYTESFTNSILISSITTGVAILADKLLDNGKTSTTTTSNVNGDTPTTQSGSSGSQAVNSAVQTMGAVTQGILQESLQIRPTITVDQGTRVKVFVNRDLIFPADLSSQVRFVQ